MWTPDVYQGAPTPTTAFMSVGAKAGGFAALIRVLVIAFPALSGTWGLLTTIIAALTLILGNVVAISQSNVKRLLAYSSIAHAGYVLLAVSDAWQNRRQELLDGSDIELNVGDLVIADERSPLALAGIPASPNIVLQTTGQNTMVVSDLPGPTGGIMLKSATGASIIYGKAAEGRVEFPGPFDLDAIDAPPVGLVDRDDVGKFQQAALDALQLVARAWNRHDDEHVDHVGDGGLGLADADRLDQNHVEAGGLGDGDGLAGRLGHASEAGTGGRGADEGVLFTREAFHPCLVAQDRSARAGRSRSVRDR